MTVPKFSESTLVGAVRATQAAERDVSLDQLYGFFRQIDDLMTSKDWNALGELGVTVKPYEHSASGLSFAQGLELRIPNALSRSGLSDADLRSRTSELGTVLSENRDPQFVRVFAQLEDSPHHKGEAGVEPDLVIRFPNYEWVNQGGGEPLRLPDRYKELT